MDRRAQRVMATLSYKLPCIRVNLKSAVINICYLEFLGPASLLRGGFLIRQGVKSDIKEVKNFQSFAQTVLVTWVFSRRQNAHSSVKAFVNYVGAVQ